MRSDQPGGDLLAAGVEAMTEAAFRTGDYTVAGQRLHAARERAAAAGDRAAEAAALDRLGWLMHFQTLDRGLTDADADAEEALFAQALAIRRERGDLAGVAESLFGVGLVHQVLRHDWATARACFFEALPLAEEHGGNLICSEIHRHIGFYYLVEDVQLDLAREHLRVSLELRRRHGDPRWVPSGTLALGQAELVAGRTAEAVSRLREAVRQARAAGLTPQRVAQAETWLGRAERGEIPTLRWGPTWTRHASNRSEPRKPSPHAAGPPQPDYQESRHGSDELRVMYEVQVSRRSFQKGSLGVTAPLRCRSWCRRWMLRPTRS